MLFLDSSVEAEYHRWIAKVPEDPYATKSTIGLHDVLRAHFLIIDYFSTEAGGEGVGGIGPKSLDLLQSAVYRQFVSFDGKDKWQTAYEKAATLLFGIVKNHPFHDANKRTGFLTTLLFLHRIGRIPRIDQRKFEDFVVDVADDQLQKYPRFRDLSEKVQDPEVQFIADFLKRNSRDIDNRSYFVTFHELNQILKRHGFELVNPRGNFIDVVQISQREDGMFGPHHSTRIETKLTSIGFPGWKKQVSIGDIKLVRDATNLTPAKGFDSKTFFQGADPVHALIDTYAEPLRRLANR